MQIPTKLLIAGLVLVLLPAAGFAQQGLEGRWEGTVSMPQGERPASATFKKEGAGYTGTISGMRGDVPFKEVKVDGNKVTARAEIESAQGTFAVTYQFELAGENLTGTGDLNFGGQSLTLNYALKRASAVAAAAPATAQSAAGPAGNWEGTVQTPQGQQPARASFKKEGDGYAGTISGMRGDVAFKDLKVEGSTITARVEMETGQGTFAIKYKFQLAGDSLKGTGELDFGGQAFTLDYDMKRAGSAAAAAPAAGQQRGAGGQGMRRESVPQPTQEQKLDYFKGDWTFKWMGRDSALGPGGSIEGDITYAPVLNAKILEGHTRAEVDGGKIHYRSFIGFDPEKKLLTFFENRDAGIILAGIGDWSSPLAARFEFVPVKNNNQTLNLRRTLSIVSEFSFTVTDELSVDGGPFQRLGNGVFSKTTTTSTAK